jgi:hypothetical protein
VVVRVLRFVFCVTANYSINRELTIVFFGRGVLLVLTDRVSTTLAR